MAARRGIVENMKGTLRQKTNEELYSILAEERLDDSFEERKIAINEILNERESEILKTTEKNANVSNEIVKSMTLPSPDHGYVSEYGVARSLSGLVIVVGWIVVVIGVILSFVLIASVFKSGLNIYGLAAILPGLGAVGGGLVMIMSGQITMATLDSADNTGRILNTVRKMSK